MSISTSAASQAIPLSNRLEAEEYGSPELNAAIYEAFGFEIRWRSYMGEALFGPVQRTKPEVVSAPELSGFKPRNWGFRGDVQPITTLLDRAIGFFKYVRPFVGHSFAIKYGSDTTCEVDITTADGTKMWNAKGSSEQMAMCACMCRVLERPA